MTASSILITGATLVDGRTTDLLIRDGVIAQMGKLTSSQADRAIDASGLIALPGLVDMHTHLREPGFEQSETVLTGTQAAAAGGFTAVFAMANTSPVADNAGVVEQELERGKRSGYAYVQPIGAVTQGLEGQRLAELGAMASSRARVRVFSDDGICVSDPLLMRRALEYVKAFGGVVAQHAQDPRLTEGAQMNEGALSSELGLAGWPAMAEESIIARDVLIAEHVGSRLHVCHVSTAGSVDVIRWAKRRGIHVTAEVTPHHLMLTEDRISGYDPRYKVNPPLRSREDVVALREGLADGSIDIVATDHAPHSEVKKQCEWNVAANGMVGLESALRVVHGAMVSDGPFEWADVARVLSESPAQIGGLPEHGSPLREGAPANIALYDPSPSSEFTVDDLHGRSRNSPYTGETLPGRVVTTLYRGVPTFEDGQLAAPDVVEAEASRG